MAEAREKVYEPIYRKALLNRGITLSIISALFIITIGAVSGGIIQMGGGSFENQNYATVTLKMPPGTPVATTLATLSDLQESGITTAKAFSEAEGKEVLESADFDKLLKK